MLKCLRTVLRGCLRTFFKKTPANTIVFVILLILTAVTGIIPRNEFQIFLLLATFLMAGLFLKRQWFFAGIAVMIISIIFTIHDLTKVDSNGSGKFIKKFQFQMGDDQKEEEE